MKNDSWDQRCQRCGRCCYEKFEQNGRVYYTDVPCQHLDLQTRSCRIFPERHRLHPECLPLTSETLDRGILPQDCPYVVDIVGYNAPQLLDEESW